MEICCICFLSGYKFSNVYHDCINSTTTPIIEVIAECLKGRDYSLQEDGICENCLDILSKYYKTAQLALKIKNEIIDIIYNPISKIREAKSLERNEIKSNFIGMNESIDLLNHENDAHMSKNISIKTEDCNNGLMEEECINPHDYEIEFLPQNEDSCENETIVSENACQGKKNTDVYCSDCSETFNNQRSYRSHYKKFHFSGYICDECGKSLTSYSGFFAHKQMHDPIKPYECLECGERFRHKRQLNYHRAWHTGEKPFQCEICSKQFVHRVALHKHKQIHDKGNRRYVCDVCSAKFRTSAHLRRHKMTHTGVKPHCCHICGKCFAQAYNMRVHVKEHQMPGSTRQRRYKCLQCNCTFTNKKNFENHTKQNNCTAKE